MYGAALATITLAWNIGRAMRDRGRLKVHCFIGSIITEGLPPDGKRYLIWQITNSGTRPILVTHACGRTKPADGADHFMVKTDKLPKMLQPGEYVMVECKDLTILPSTTHLYVTDSLGKKHFAPRQTVKAVRKQLSAAPREE